MRRFKVALIAAATLTIALSGVTQASHGGPDHRADGRGERDAPPATTRLCIQTTIFFGCATELVTTTDTAESFAFDARVGSRSPDAHGHISYEVTTHRVVSVERTPAGDAFCPTQPGFCIPESTTESTTEIKLRADVTCLTVLQNHASIGGHITRWDGSTPPTGRGILLNVTDNTVAREQFGGPDRFIGAVQVDVPQVCPAPTGDLPITKGDIFVDQS